MVCAKFQTDQVNWNGCYGQKRCYKIWVEDGFLYRNRAQTPISQTVMSSQSISCKNMLFDMKNNIIISRHNFGHAMAAQLSWHVQNCDLIVSLQSQWEQKEIFQDFNLKLMNCCLWIVSRTHHTLVATEPIEGSSHNDGMGAKLPIWNGACHWGVGIPKANEMMETSPYIS